MKGQGQDNTKLLQKRTAKVVEWLLKHEHLFNQTDAVKVELNIKGESVKGTFTQYPQE